MVKLTNLYIVSYFARILFLPQILFAPILPFVGHPDRIAIVAILFLAVCVALKTVRHSWSRPLLWTTGLWVAFALWEWLMLVQNTNIRVDVIVIYPLLLGVTIWGIGAALRYSKTMTYGEKQ